MSKYPLSLETCHEKWLEEHLKNPKMSYEASTIRDYRFSGKIAMKDMEEAGCTPLPYKWTADDIHALIEYWTEERELRVKTQKGYYSALCNIAKFYGNREPGDMRIKWPHEETLIKWLTLDQAKQIVNTPMSEIQAMGIELMLRMGRRRIECVRAQLSDMRYDAPDPYMFVDGKGHKRHKMPFAPTTDKILGRWLDVRADIIREYAPKGARIDDLFIWGRGKTVAPFKQPKCSGFDDAITKDVSIRSRIDFSNHVLRRTFGRELYFTNRVDMKLIQSYYNHSSREMTEHYIGADLTRMAEGVKHMPF